MRYLFLIFVVSILPLFAFSLPAENFPEMEKEFGCEKETGANYCFSGVTFLKEKEFAIINWKLEYEENLKSDALTKKVIAQLSTSLLKSFHLKAARDNGLGIGLTELLENKFNKKVVLIGLNSIIGDHSYTTVTYLDSNNDIITRTISGSEKPVNFLLEECKNSNLCSEIR